MKQLKDVDSIGNYYSKETKTDREVHYMGYRDGIPVASVCSCAEAYIYTCMCHAVSSPTL